MSTSLRHGIFLGPWHALDESPTLAIQRDLKLVQLLDELGFAEVWVGEHHSGGWEMITSPDLFIAGAAERTKRIRLVTGVVSVSYHNPFIVAERLMHQCCDNPLPHPPRPSHTLVRADSPRRSCDATSFIRSLERHERRAAPARSTVAKRIRSLRPTSVASPLSFNRSR